MRCFTEKDSAEVVIARNRAANARLQGFVPVSDPDRAAAAGFAGPFLQVDFDFVLSRDSTTTGG